MPKRNDQTPLFASLCVASGHEKPIAEYLFAPPRKWRFDWAFITAKVAIEVQGGIFIKGRHVQGAALLKEFEKLNAACCLGWRVLFVVPRDMENGSIFALLEKALATGKPPA